MEFKHRPVWHYNATIDNFKMEDIPTEARDFIQKGVIPQLNENNMECDEFDVMINFVPRPDTMNLAFILFIELNKGLLEIALPIKLDKYDICENLDNLVADALEKPFDIVIPWTQNEVDLRWMDLMIELLEKPLDEIFSNNQIQVKLSDKYIRADKDDHMHIYHKGIYRGTVSETGAPAEFTNIIANHFHEYMNESLLHTIRGELKEYRKHFIYETHADALYEKMKQEPDTDEAERTE